MQPHIHPKPFIREEKGQNRQLHIMDFIPVNSFGAVSQLVLLAGAVAGTQDMTIVSGFISYLRDQRPFWASQKEKILLYLAGGTAVQRRRPWRPCRQD